MSLSFSSVAIRRGRKTIIDEVTVSFEPGTMTAIVGPNGAGKSTVLACGAGVIRPARGEVELMGRTIASTPAPQLARLRAYLPQTPSPETPFTAEAVVRMGRYTLERTEPLGDTASTTAQAMERLGVSDLATRRMMDLSGGERARVSLARIVAQDAPLILLDEPTSALDIGQQDLAMRVFRRLAAEGRTVVVVAHDLNLAAAHADRILLLAGGRIAADGAPVDVLTSDHLSTAYDHPITVVRHPLRSTPLVVSDVAGS